MLLERIGAVVAAIEDADRRASGGVVGPRTPERLASLTDAIIRGAMRAVVSRWTAARQAERDIDARLAHADHRLEHALAQVAGSLFEPLGQAAGCAKDDVEAIGVAYENLMGLEIGIDGAGALALRGGLARRRSGSHYTPRSLTTSVVSETLAPLFDRAGADAGRLLEITVCDPAMGTGAFLIEACRQIAARVAEASSSGEPPRAAEICEDDILRARRAVAERCIFGVDKNPLAVELARLSMWLLVKDAPLSFVDAKLRAGDSIVGRPRPRQKVESARAEPSQPFHWDAEFRGVMSGGGFRAILGNPPWVSYAGRAAQPIDPELRARLIEAFEGFAGYRNLQGVFVERAVRDLLAPNGRLGFVLPSSMAELDGYAPTRAAHDRFAVCDPDLPDVREDAFLGVFQPSMVLRSTRRAQPIERGPGAPWPIARPDLDAEATRILALLGGATLPPALFGERGLQSSGADLDHLLRDARPGTTPIRNGGDIQAFVRLGASMHAERAWFARRLRTPAEWRSVKVLVRQTARVPIAVRSDGEAFRNSILAAFEDDAHPADFLVAWLNSTPIRWFHYHRNRDARLGMPQVKIGHLRALPAPRDRAAIDSLAELGAAWSQRNTGMSEAEQRRLDEIVALALHLDHGAFERMRHDARAWQSTRASASGSPATPVTGS
jgi:hypothetical protein